MLDLVPYYALTLCLLSVYGLLPFLILRQDLPANPFVTLLTGFAVTGFISQLCWIAGPVHTWYGYLLLLACVPVVYFYRVGYRSYFRGIARWLYATKPLFKIALGLLTIAVIYQTAQPYKITDMAIYYLQTMKWMQGFGVVKGLANVHPALGLGSAWHSLVVMCNGLSITGDQKWQLNGVLLLVFICFHLYEADTKDSIYLKATFLLCLPLSFLYLTAPSPDLPVLLLGTVLLYLAVNDEGNMHWQLMLLTCIFLFMCKPPAFIALLAAFTYFLKLPAWRTKIQFALFGLVLCMPLLYKNYVLSGYFLYPFNKPDVIDARWKVPADWNEMYRKGVISWGLVDRTDKSTLLQKGHPAENRLMVWLSRSGYKGFMNKLIFINFLIGLGLLFFELFNRRKPFSMQACFVYIALIAISVIEWFTLSQYRLMLTTAVVLAGLNFSTILMHVNTAYLKIINAKLNGVKMLFIACCIFCAMAFIPFSILSRESRNKDITQSAGFNSAFLVKPFHGSESLQTDSFRAGSIYIYYYPEQLYCVDCKVPCVNNSHRNYLRDNFGYSLQPIGNTIDEGFALER